MSLIAAKADYITKANEIYKRLEDFKELFEIEAAVIEYSKCALVQEVPLSDFEVDGVRVFVYNSSGGYSLYFLNYLMEIDVYEKQIVNFDVRSLD